MLAIATKYAPKNYYSWISFFFRIFGLLPPKQKKQTYFYLAVSNLFVCVYLLMFLECYILVRDFSKAFARTLINIVTVVAGSIVTARVTYWIFYKDQFLAIKSIIERDSFEFSCFSIRSIKRSNEVAKGVLDYEHLRKLWSNAALTLDEGSNQVEVYRKEIMLLTRLRCCILYLTFNLLAIFVYAGSYKSAELQEIKASNTTYAIWAYSNMICLKFDAPFFDRHGWVLDFYQIYGYVVRMSIFIPVLIGITTTIMHLIAQIKTVGKGFSCVDEDVDPNQTQETVLLIKRIRMVKCITELQEIYRAIRLMEGFISLQMLYQYGMYIVMLCAASYAAAMVNNVQEVVCVATFVLGCLGEIFFFTYFSHTLSQELQNLLIPVYALNWTGYPKILKQNVLFLIQRLQKRDILTAGKIINLDLLFFVQVLQKSYSLYTVISTTKDSK